jgi:hypothetical protein
MKKTRRHQRLKASSPTDEVSQEAGSSIAAFGETAGKLRKRSEIDAFAVAEVSENAAKTRKKAAQAAAEVPAVVGKNSALTETHPAPEAQVEPALPTPVPGEASRDGEPNASARAERPSQSKRSFEPGRAERAELARSLAASLAEVGIPAAPSGDLLQVIGAFSAGVRQLTQGKQAAEAELARSIADRTALKALVATQREELQSLRQQVEAAIETLRQQRAIDGRQLTELNEQYGDLLKAHRELRVQADTIYSIFEHLRAEGLRGIWQVFGPALRDHEVYDAVVLILSSGLFDEAFFYRQCRSGEIPAGLTPLIYYLRRGDSLGRDPHPLFSQRHYRNQVTTLRVANNTLVDYLQAGHDVAPHPLFMPSYYVEQLPGLANITGVAPLVHYCIAGKVSGANPHPLFDIAYYRKELEARGVQPTTELVEFYLSGRAPEISPHPLFDPEFYRSRYLADQSGTNPLVHYLTEGDTEGSNPHPYFHTRFYRLTNPDLAEDGSAALVHFVMKGADENRAPHPMFDLAHYKRANPELGETGYRLLAHFATEGEEKGSSPHPLIDLAYVRRQLTDRGADAGRPFRALLDPANVEWLSPHPLFDVTFYREVSPGASSYAGGAFLYYLLAGRKLDEPVHPLFDPGFYRAQAEANEIEITDPLADFLTNEREGDGASLNPHPLFSVAYYLNAGAAIEGNPLLHYLERGDKRGRNPHPLFDVAYYKRTAGIEDEVAVVHYLGTAGRAGDPHPLFATEHYLAALPAPLPAGTVPLVHYLFDEDGAATDPHPLFDQDFYWSQIAAEERRIEPALLHYLAQGAAAPSPHPLFDRDYFAAGYRGVEPALAAFVRQFQEGDGAARALHLVDWREANRAFCSLSYLLDHPDLPPGEIPMLHYLRGRDPDDPLPEIEEPQFAGGFAFISRDLHHAAIDPQRLIDCVRERNRRSAAADRRTREADYHKLGEQLAGVEVWSALTGDDTGLVARVADNARIAIYVLEPAWNGLRPYQRQMVAGLRDAGYVTVVVAPSAEDGEPLDDDNDVDVWVSHPDRRNDFRVWAAALAHLAPSLEGAEHLLLCNDNLVGPIGELRPTLQRLERNPAQIRGLTETVKGERRLQADLMLFGGEAMTSGALPRLLSTGLATSRPKQPLEVPIGEDWEGADRIAAIVDYAELSAAWAHGVPDQIAWARALPKRLDESGLATHLPRAIVGRYADYLEDWLVDRLERVEQGEHFDPQHVFWDALLGFGCPFVNKELLLVNPQRVPTLIRLGEICARYGDETALAALRALAPPGRTGFPRSYLRLSEALIDAAAVMA